jgi:hypothetical protein
VVIWVIEVLVGLPEVIWEFVRYVVLSTLCWGYLVLFGLLRGYLWLFGLWW